uniref:Uncharacterized protein n=1 Tax=Ciona intestinalis TaxID=7719 RepID=H2XS15_CIOIN
MQSHVLCILFNMKSSKFGCKINGKCFREE